jgi:hypothetical protein
VRSPGLEVHEHLSVALLDPAEASELPLDPVPVTVVVEYSVVSRPPDMASIASTRYTTWDGER